MPCKRQYLIRVLQAFKENFHGWTEPEPAFGSKNGDLPKRRGGDGNRFPGIPGLRQGRQCRNRNQAVILCHPDHHIRVEQQQSVILPIVQIIHRGEKIANDLYATNLKDRQRIGIRSLIQRYELSNRLPVFCHQNRLPLRLHLVQNCQKLCLALAAPIVLMASPHVTTLRWSHFYCPTPFRLKIGR